MMTTIVGLMVFIIGASIGSFLNVLIDRLPKEESINGRSHCDYCGKKIAWYDLTPIFSYFFLGGKTRCCHKKLSFQYPLIEIVTGLSFLLITNNQIPITKQISILNSQYSNLWLFSNWNLFVSWLLFLGISSCLIVIFVSDLKYHLISDYILLALFIFSILLHVLGSTQGSTPTPIQLITSGLVVAFPIWLIYFISKERAMGLGDVYLSAVMGFLLGWKEGLLALYIAFITGAIFGLTLILLKNKKLKSKVAFGPFLVIGTVLMLFWGEMILKITGRVYGF